MTEEEIKQIEARWKSDIDKKMDRLVEIAERFSIFQAAYEEYLKMALDREMNSKKWRQAVMEKSTIGFIWAAIGFLGIAAWEYIQRHISK